jgi:hypothetical protein
MFKWCAELTKLQPWCFVFFENTDVTWLLPENLDRCVFTLFVSATSCGCVLVTPPCCLLAPQACIVKPRRTAGSLCGGVLCGASGVVRRSVPREPAGELVRARGDEDSVVPTGG